MLQATGLGGGRVSRPHGAKLAHRLGERGIDLVRVEVRVRVRVKVRVRARVRVRNAGSTGLGLGARGRPRRGSSG